MENASRETENIAIVLILPVTHLSCVFDGLKDFCAVFLIKLIYFVSLALFF